MHLTCLTCGQVNRLDPDKVMKGPKCAVCGAALTGPQVAAIDLATLEKAARQDGLPLVVDFWAPWCGPCRAMAPQFAQAAGRLQGHVRFAKLNTEDEPAATGRFGIRGIPTMIRFSGGAEDRRQSGAMAAQQILAWAQ